MFSVLELVSNRRVLVLSGVVQLFSYALGVCDPATPRAATYETTRRPPSGPVNRDHVNVDTVRAGWARCGSEGSPQRLAAGSRPRARQTLCSLHDVLRHPLREALFADSMGTRARVLLMDGRQPFARKSIGDADQGGPQAAVDEGHLPVDEPRADNVR